MSNKVWRCFRRQLNISVAKFRPIGERSLPSSQFRADQRGNFRRTLEPVRHRIGRKTAIRQEIREKLVRPKTRIASAAEPVKQTAVITRARFRCSFSLADMRGNVGHFVLSLFFCSEISSRSMRSHLSPWEHMLHRAARKSHHGGPEFVMIS